jgi:hypothetical protein
LACYCTSALYDRSASYQVEAKKTEVQSVTIQSETYAVTNRHFHLDVKEHCLQDEQDEVYVDGVTGATKPELSKYLSTYPIDVTHDIEKHIPVNSITFASSTKYL